MRTLTVTMLLLLCAGLRPAYADGHVPLELLARLEALAPGMTPDHIVESPVAGMYEVRFGAVVVYLSGDGRYIFRGDMRDLDTGRNFTEEARRTARVDAIGALGEANMIVFAPDTVRHTVTVFTDVDCTYCARLHRQMADYNRLGIKVRYTAFPRAGVGSPTFDTMVSVWCAEDQQQAMTDAKARIEIEPARCEHPVREHYETGQRIGVTGTPAIVLESGEIVPGYVPPEELARSLDEQRGAG